MQVNPQPQQSRLRFQHFCNCTLGQNFDWYLVPGSGKSIGHGMPPPPKKCGVQNHSSHQCYFYPKKERKKKGPPIPRENTFPYWGTQMELPIPVCNLYTTAHGNTTQATEQGQGDGTCILMDARWVHKPLSPSRNS